MENRIQRQEKRILQLQQRPHLITSTSNNGCGVNRRGVVAAEGVVEPDRPELVEPERGGMLEPDRPGMLELDRAGMLEPDRGGVSGAGLEVDIGAGRGGHGVKHHRGYQQYRTTN